MLIATRIQQSVFERLLWITETLPDAAWGYRYSARLEAKRARDYKIIAGALPPGLALRGDRVTGSPSPAPGAPQWVTPAGSLGEAVQGGEFSVTLAADGAKSFTIEAGTLPWGLILELTSGTLTGKLMRTGGPLDGPRPPPQWVTPAGSLGEFGEGESLTLSFAATGVSVYSIVGGRFPWGAILNSASGAISGVIANVGGEILEPEAEIVWTAPAATQLGSFPRGATLAIPQTAAPATRFWIANGNLPWGLTLDPGSGTIGGTLNPVNRSGIHEFTVSARGAGSFGQRLYSIAIS